MFRLSAIVLCFALLWGNLINIAIYAWYEIDKAYIASELCENRFVEDSDCEGHCVLEKKIDKTHSTDKFIPEARFPVYLVPDSKVDRDPTIVVQRFTKVCNRILQDGVHSDVFHPPRLV